MHIHVTGERRTLYSYLSKALDDCRPQSLRGEVGLSRTASRISAENWESLTARAKSIAPTKLASEAGLEPAQSTALIVQGLNAYLLVKMAAPLQAGQSVLVHSAAGGVGTLAVQLAKLLGAGRVIATAGTEEKLSKARSLGADAAVNYTQSGWPQQVLAANGGRGVDIVLESAGGEVFERSFEALAPFGHLVAFGASSGQIPALNGIRLLGPNHSVSGF